MSRLNAFWEEFLKSFHWVEKAAGKIDYVQKIIGYAWPLLGLLGITAAIVSRAFQPFMPYCIDMMILYLVWKVAIAWDRSAGPIIWIGKPEFDKEHSVFDIRIENRGHGLVYAYGYITDLRTSNGDRPIGVISELQLNWFNLDAGKEMSLYGTRHGTLFLANVVHDAGRIPSLALFVRDKKDDRILPLYNAVPLEKQLDIHATLDIRFYDTKYTPIKSKVIKYIFTPDSESFTSYKIRSTGFS